MVKSTYSFKYEDIVWLNVILFTYIHVTGFYVIYWMLTGQYFLKTIVFGYLYGWFGSISVTVGAHRLWSHCAYKATWQLKSLLILLNCIASQNSIYEWVRDHRVHHKFTDTDADPHNYSRGFFFAHMGWLLVRKHPDVKQKGKLIDMSDLERDPYVMFQKKYYHILVLFFSFILPTMFFHWWTRESLLMLWSGVGVFRYILSLHLTWLVNSAAHSWGHKPFDKSIKPTDNKITAFLTIGEGWHNYHHTFPWDYKAAELGNYCTNVSTGIIDFFAKIGWAYDLKYVSDEMICKRALRTGDGSFAIKKFKGVDMNGVPEEDLKVDYGNMIWGWTDPDMSEKVKRYASVINPVED